MTLYFWVDRIAALRNGINTSEKNVSINIDPTTLSDETRAILAARINQHGTVCSRDIHGHFFDGYYSPSTPPSTAYEDGKNGREIRRVTATAPTLDALLLAIADEERAIRKEEERKVAEKKENEDRIREETLAVLRDRKTVERKSYIGARRNQFGTIDFVNSLGTETGIVTYVNPAWPYQSDDAVKSSPEAIAWMDMLETENRASEEAVKSTIVDKLLRKEAEKKQAEEDRIAWIAAHGSPRLQRCQHEGIECEAIYRDERLSFDRPGWRWEKDVRGKALEPRNPSSNWFKLLDEARAIDPDAKLSFWKAEEGFDDDSDEVPEWRGYVAISQFLGEEIVFGGPED